jgi:hypothetical protein
MGRMIFISANDRYVTVSGVNYGVASWDLALSHPRHTLAQFLDELPLRGSDFVIFHGEEH